MTCGRNFDSYLQKGSKCSLLLNRSNRNEETTEGFFVVVFGVLFHKKLRIAMNLLLLQNRDLQSRDAPPPSKTNLVQITHLKRGVRIFTPVLPSFYCQMTAASVVSSESPLCSGAFFTSPRALIPEIMSDDKLKRTGKCVVLKFKSVILRRTVFSRVALAVDFVNKCIFGGLLFVSFVL